MDKGKHLIKMLNIKTEHVKDQFTVLQRTVSKDTTRFFMLYAKYFHDDKVIVAIDGRRLTLLDVSKLHFKGQFPQHDCLVELEKDNLFFYNTELMEGTFPNYKRAVPNLSEYITNNVEYTFCKATKKNAFGISNSNKYVPQFYTDYRVVVNLQYLLDLQEDTYKVYCHKDKELRYQRAVVFQSHLLKVVIMPIFVVNNDEVATKNFIENFEK